MSESPAPAAAPPPAAWRFARFELKPGERQLVADGVPVKLGGRAFDMLVALLERHQRVVSKHELMDVVWPKLVVEENNLQVQVLALRKLLGPAAIATVPGRGYRLTLAVEVVGAASRASPAAPPPPPSPQRTNLTARLPPMVGRAADLAALRGLLRRAHAGVDRRCRGHRQDTARAGARRRDRRRTFRTAPGWSSLASLADPALVASAVARVAGIALSAERPAVEAVVSVLRSQRMLLVLDNCEHLLDGVVDLVDALRRAAPDVRLLVTSQEPLKVVDEQVYRLVTLAVPPAQAEDAGRLQRRPAVRCAPRRPPSRGSR